MPSHSTAVVGLALMAVGWWTAPLVAQLPSDLPLVPDAEVLLAPGVRSGLPLVVPNDNTVPAGTTRDGVRVVELEVVQADWRPEHDGGPGLRVNAIAEVGGTPRIPAPLLRVEAGTRLRVSVVNRTERAVTVVGLHARPGPRDGAPFVVSPGATGTAEFDAGDPGTYLYTVREWDMKPTDEDLEGLVERRAPVP